MNDDKYNKMIFYVKKWEDAADLMDIDIKLFEKDYINLNKGEIAYRKLLIITKVLNEDWVKDFNNDEYYYEPYFLYNKEISTFSYNYYYDWVTSSFVGSGWGLYYRTPELAKYCGEQFIDLWNDYLKYNKPFNILEKYVQKL